MKKLAAIAVSAGMALCLCSCGKSVTLKIKEKNVRMNVDEKYTVKVQTNSKEDVTWTSNDEKIALVGTDGTVTAIGNGITTVTARSGSAYAHIGIIVGGDDYTDEYGNSVTVFGGESDIEEITVGVKAGGKGDISLKQGEKHELKAYVVPSDSKDKIVWKTDDGAVARVTAKGELEAVGKGKTTIYAYAPNGVKGTLIVRVR